MRFAPDDLSTLLPDCSALSRAEPRALHHRHQGGPRQRPWRQQMKLKSPRPQLHAIRAVGAVWWRARRWSPPPSSEWPPITPRQPRPTEADITIGPRTRPRRVHPPGRRRLQPQCLRRRTLQRPRRPPRCRPPRCRHRHRPARRPVRHQGHRSCSLTMWPSGTSCVVPTTLQWTTPSSSRANRACPTCIRSTATPRRMPSAPLPAFRRRARRAAAAAWGRAIFRRTGCRR